LAIRECSTNSLKQLISKLKTITLSSHEISWLESKFLYEIRCGLSNKKEIARHEFVTLLVEFINAFKNIFPYLNDLCHLMDTLDVEKDFYENIKHIQMHRRARALKKLQRACDERLLSAKCLLDYMMPLVRSFIQDEAYQKHDHLIDEACKTIGRICSSLAWPKYVKCLEFYMRELPKGKLEQKIVIKIIVHVLDAFHFDLSEASNKNSYFKESKITYINQSNENPKKLDEGNDETEKEATDDALAEEEKNQNEAVPITEASKMQPVTKQLAERIYDRISHSILPSLFKALTKRLKSEDEHKLTKKENEDEQIVRVPIALAILKLLKCLPSGALHTHLPGLLLKVCDMLKSRAMSVRMSARECLLKMINTLPNKRYYVYIFREMCNTLTRGYQVHVLCYTIQMLLKSVQDKLSVGDLEPSLSLIIKSIKMELFGEDTAEEKEVKQILAKVTEAKTISSYNTLEICAKFVNHNRIFDLIWPFKQELNVCNSRKLLRKIEEALRRVLLGILNNTSFTGELFMQLVSNLINETFPAIKSSLSKKRKSKNELNATDHDEDEETDPLRQSCLIIPAEPKRGGDKPKIQSRTNQHVIVEFALNVDI
jgi:U3 small nucleolar RNA-associated protein 20